MKHLYLKGILLFFLTFVSISAYTYDFKVDGIYYNITSSKNFNVAVTHNNYPENDYKGDVIIPETIVYDGETYHVTAIGESAFSDCTRLTSISIPSTVKSIDYGAFSRCSRLTSIVIPESVRTIGVFAFAGCSGLSSLIIPNGVTSIEGGAFAGCGNLVSVAIPPSVTSIATGDGEAVFDECTSLKSVHITDLAAWCNIHFDYPQDNPLFFAHQLFLNDKEITNITIPQSVTSIGNAVFAGFEGLSEVTIPNTITSIGQYAFQGCTGLTAVSIPNSVTSIGASAFRDCTGLTTMGVPSGVTSIGYEVFRNCKSLTSVAIPESVTEIRSSAFEGCSGLTSVTIPNNVTEIGSSAFEGCSSLTSVTSLNTTPPTISLYSPTFDESTEKSAVLDVPIGCKKKYASHPYWGKFSNITEGGMTDESIINFADPLVKAICVKKWDINGDGELSRKEAAAVKNLGTVFSDNPSITSFNELQYFTGLTYIEYHAFWECTGLTSVIIPNSVTSIRANAFWNCTGLASVIIPNSVTSIGIATFSKCVSLTSVNIPNSVVMIENQAFYGCTGLTSVTIPNSIASIDKEVFRGCSGLTRIVIPNSVTSIDKGAFYGCSGISSLILGNSVTSIGENAFFGCTGLNVITIPNSVTSIDKGAFSGCSGISSLILGNSVTSIGDYAFQNCSKLTSIEIPNSVSTIGNSFNGCTGLTSLAFHCKKIGNWFDYSYKRNINNITIGDEVETIGESAFYGFTGLTYLSIGNSVTSVGTNSLYGCTGLTSLSFHCKNIGNWFNYDYKQNIKRITIGNEVNTIGNSAFSGFTGLTSIEIPNNITSIGGNAFNGCKNLSSVLSKIMSPPRIDNNVFNGISSNAILQVPRGKRNTYLNTNYWSPHFKEIVEEGCWNVLIKATGNGVASYEDTEIRNQTVTISVEKGSDAIIVLTPDTGYKINSVKLNGIDVTSEVVDNHYTINGINTNTTTLEVEFKIGTYVITYYVDGVEYLKTPLEYGTTIKPASVPTKEGYTFSGWSEIPKTMPDHDVTVTGTFTINSYKLTYYIDDKIYKSYNIEYNSVIIPEPVPIKKGMTFSGWDNLPETMPAHNVTSTGTYSWQKKTLNNVIYQVTDTLNNYVSVVGNDGAYGDVEILSSIEIEGYNYSVKNIENSAFNNCIEMTSIIIPESVTNIANNAFSDCNNLTMVTIGSNTILSKSYSPSSSLKSIFGAQVKEYIIGDKVTKIGDNAFYGCSVVTSFSIPSSVKSIGKDAFFNCSGLTAVYITNLPSWCSISFYNSSANPLSYAHHLYLNGVEVTGDLTIPNNVSDLGSYTFYNCSGLTSVTIPNSVTSIGSYTFYGCSELTSVTISDNVTYIGTFTFNEAPIYVKRGTKSLLTLWRTNYIPYEMKTNILLECPTFELVSTTQTTATFQINNLYNEYTYTCFDEVITKNRYTRKRLIPQHEYNVSFYISLGDYQGYSKGVTYKTLPISPTASAIKKTASSILAKGSYLAGDAQVVSQKIKIDGEEHDGDEVFVTGLDPNTTHRVTYYIYIAVGDNGTHLFDTSLTVSTDPLILTTSQPKVISLGNVIVAAESNLDDEEMNVGFEWRRIDWTDDFASSAGNAALYEGAMEGYIRNLNTEKLWKYRPYYLSNSGTYYFGAWMGLDPTNTSYFSPTVHTYDKISLAGNTALVKGYAMRGSDNVTRQGFMYWKTPSQPSPNARERRASAIPLNAMIVESQGNVMTATLENLEYDTKYCYVAFVTTADNETFYGEEQTFKTGMSQDMIDAIEEIGTDNADDVIEIARYDLNGRKIAGPQKGINIIRYSDGTSKKVILK